MTEPSEAAAAATEIIELLYDSDYFDDAVNRDGRIMAAKSVRPIIQRLSDGRDAEIKRLKNYLSQVTKCRECGQRYVRGERECKTCGGPCVKIIFYPYEF